MTTAKRSSKTVTLSLYALLTALLIVLGYVNIPQPAGLSITFNMIPVAIAAIAMGIPGGAIIGGVFGLISFLQCFGLVGFSGMGAVLVGISPVLTFIQRFVSRVLFGNTEYIQNMMAGRGVITFIIASVGINAVVEMIVAAVVTGAVGAALKKARLI